MEQIKMTYAQVSKMEFVRAMQKLASTPVDTKLAFQIKKLVEAINKVRSTIADEYKAKVVDEFAQKDADGNVIHPEGRADAFDIQDEMKDKFLAAQDAFGNTEFTIDRWPLSLSQLGGLKFSAAELSALEPVLTEDEPAGDNVVKLGG